MCRRLRGLPIDAPERVLYVSMRNTQNQLAGLLDAAHELLWVEESSHA